MNSEPMQQLRNRMLAGEHIPNCGKCYFNEKAQGISMRSGMIEKYGRPTAPILRYLEMNFGNLCNLKCRMCSSGGSSKWIIDDPKFGRTPYNLLRRSFSDIHLDFTTLETIKLIGGEPSLEQDSIKEMLDHIERSRGTLEHLELEIFTNGMVRFDEPIMQALSRCRCVEFCISIDGMPVPNDYQRTGCKWEVLWDNVMYYDTYSSHRFQISVSSAVGIYTIADFHEFVDMVTTQLPSARHLVNLIQEPREQYIGNLPHGYKESLISMLEAWQPLPPKSLGYQPPLGRTNHANIKALLLHACGTAAKVNLRQVQQHTALLDQLRGERLSDMNPALNMAIFGD